MSLQVDSYEQIIEKLHDGLYLVNRNRVITYWNKAAEHISGFTADEVLGRPCSDNILTHIDAKGNCLCTGICPLTKAMQDEMPSETEIYMHHKDGHRIPVSVRTSPLTNCSGEVLGGIELFTDISSQKSNELRVVELEALALLDNLTQLANRRYIEQELHARLEEYRRIGIPFGVLFMDIDQFKQFNDRYGHDVGDDVLKYVAKTLVADARPFDLFGRWGGEEFIGVIRNIQVNDLETLGDRTRQLIEKSYVMRGKEKLSVTISIGATLVNESDTNTSLIKRADTLLYQSKSAGRNRVTIG